MLQEVDAGMEAKRVGYKSHDKIEAAIKVFLFSFLVIFGISAFTHAFPEECDLVLFNLWMWFLLILILILGIGLFATTILSPRSLEPDGKKALVSDPREIFTHILALIITVPLIIVTTFILLPGGDHSEELTFISGLLGVIMGFYFGHRGIERAESQIDREKREKEDALREKEDALKETEDTLKKREEDLTRMLNKLESKKQEDFYKLVAWNNFKEDAKKRYKDEFEKIKNIDHYRPWEEEPPEGWNDAERKLIEQFENEWRENQW